MDHPYTAMADHQSPSGGVGATRAARQDRRISIAKNAVLSDEEIDLVLQDMANERLSLSAAGFGKQTWSRYLVENYFAKMKWYNPNIDNPDAPNLSKGWAYFEHFTLPRHFSQTHDSQSGATTKIRAPPGEAQGTELYSLFFTPQSCLNDWGIGVGMYFSTLAAMIFIFLLAGLASIPNMVFYASEEYDGGEGRKQFFLLNMLRFSVICTEREWVVCDGCKENPRYWETIFTHDYYGTAMDPVSGDEVTLISRTTCLPAEYDQGLCNFLVLVLLMVCLCLFVWYLSKLEVRYDERDTTSSDYTVFVKNPPPDALDPEEWRNFFNKFSDKQVTLCSIALNNEALLNKLVQRRRDLKSLRRLLPLGIDMEDGNTVEIAVADARKQREEEEPSCFGRIWGCTLLPLLRCCGCSQTETVIWERIKSTTKEIKELQQKEYQASAVFITFETESGQRTALEAMNASKLEVWTNTPMYIDESALFRGTVLNVEEASEPNAIRWADLSKTQIQIYVLEFGSFCVTVGLCGLSAWLLYFARTRVNTIFFSIILSTFNVVIPLIVRSMVAYERHYDEGSVQASLYIKITFFRWVNTAIVTLVITPFLAYLGENKIDLMNTVNALIIAEMLYSPLLRYFDLFTILDRHYFAPRARTQEELFDCFMGGWYNLAERFTDFTKVLLLCVFYSAFYPLIYFLGAVILFIQYWMDKFLLLRSWKKAPYLGPETARFSRTYFTTAAVALGAMSSAYFYARSPYTNLCSCEQNNRECSQVNSQEFFDVTLLNGTQFDSLETSDEIYYFCNQKEIGFPPLPEKQGANHWMTTGQERISRLYGWVVFILFIVYIVVLFGQRIIRAIRSLWRGVYKPHGTDQRKDFSSCIGIETFAYIPSLEAPGFHLPFIACDIDDIDVNLISWRDPNRQNNSNPHQNYDNQNLIFDVPCGITTRSRNATAVKSEETATPPSTKPVFGIVKHWPPEWVKKNRMMSAES